MKCPHCNETLAMSERLGIEIDYCPSCRGIWLDRGELDKIVELSLKQQSPPPLDEPRKPEPQYREERREEPRYEHKKKRYYDDDDYEHVHYRDKKYKYKKKKGILGEIFDIFD